jgi:hypothetical protein
LNGFNKWPVITVKNTITTTPNRNKGLIEAVETKARRKATKAGYAVAGKDVDHKNGNPRDNRLSNLSVKSKSSNRSKK